jgi:hypothetical protein
LKNIRQVSALNTKPQVFFCLALNDPVNEDVSSFIRWMKASPSISRVARIEVWACAPRELTFPDCVLRLEDDDSLFDFSRYAKLIAGVPSSDDDIFVLLNDTLAKGRKFNLGLKIFIFLAIFVLVFSRGKRQIWAPVDSDFFGRWVCPYIMIGRLGAIRRINFTDWRLAGSDLSRELKVKLVEWINLSWRRSSNATNQQKMIKYRTLLLERGLVSSEQISRKVVAFKRSSILRLLNAIQPHN